MKNTILVKTDSLCEMAEVWLNGELVMSGNFWDFHPGCHGINKYGDFKGYTGLVNAIQTTVGKCEVIKEDYEY